MVTKLDESSAPWALLQGLMQAHQSIALSVGSASEDLGAELQTLTPALLAELALARTLPQAQDPWAVSERRSAERRAELQVAYG